MRKLKTFQLTIYAFLIAAGIARGGIATSPWSFSKTADEWLIEDKDQEAAEGVKIEFMVSGTNSSARLLAFSAPVVDEKIALKEFALGIRKAFARSRVTDLSESEASKWGFDGLSMAFAIPSGSTEVSCDAFFFEDNGKFWAVVAFGAEQADMAKAFLTLKKKPSAQGGADQPSVAPDSKAEDNKEPEPESKPHPE